MPILLHRLLHGDGRSRRACAAGSEVNGDGLDPVEAFMVEALARRFGNEAARGRGARRAP